MMKGISSPKKKGYSHIVCAYYRVIAEDDTVITVFGFAIFFISKKNKLFTAKKYSNF